MTILESSFLFRLQDPEEIDSDSDIENQYEDYEYSNFDKRSYCK